MMPRCCRRAVNGQILFIALVLLKAILFGASVVVVASSSSSSSYAPVTALDQFGNVEQVRNARQAALQYGRLVVAAKYRPLEVTIDEKQKGPAAVVVLTLMLEQRPDLVESGLAATRSVHLLNYEVRPSSLPPNRHDLVALACTGIKPDAMWLIETIRNYVKRVWERYDTWHYSVDEMAAAVSQAMGAFWNHDRNQEWNHGAGPVVVVNDDDEDGDNSHTNTWARPLGIQALVLSTNPNDPLVVVEPSGVAQASSTALAIGQFSQDVLAQLVKKLGSRQVKSCDELIEVMVQTVHKASLESNHRKKKILIEILSSRGVERRWHS